MGAAVRPFSFDSLTHMGIGRAVPSFAISLRAIVNDDLNGPLNRVSVAEQNAVC